MKKGTTTYAVSKKSPTLAEWPKRMWSIDDIPKEYLPIIENYLPFLKFENIIIAPKVNFGGETFEYMVAFCADFVLYMQKDSDIQISTTLIKPQEVISVKQVEDLLNCKIEVFICHGGKHSVLEIGYNKTTFRLYYPLINALLGKDMNLEIASKECQDKKPDKLFSQNELLYNYANAVFRISDTLDKYKWYYKKRRGIKALLEKNKTKPCVMICECKNSHLLIDSTGYRMTYLYLMNENYRIEYQSEGDKRFIEVYIPDDNSEYLVYRGEIIINTAFTE